MIHEKTLKTTRININHCILIIFFIGWFIVWSIHTIEIISHKKRYYGFAINADLDTWRAYYSYDKDTVDFYSVVKECDRLLPPLEKLQVILPQDNLDRNNFLTEKARYYLYPRNYGENLTPQKYALIYSVPHFQIPAGYTVIKRFGPDKYLIKNSELNPSIDKK